MADQATHAVDVEQFVHVLIRATPRALAGVEVLSAMSQPKCWAHATRPGLPCPFDIRVRFQLNDLQEGGRLPAIGACPDGRAHTFRIIDPRQLSLSPHESRCALLHITATIMGGLEKHARMAARWRRTDRLPGWT
jgi:hypothetical protein